MNSCPRCRVENRTEARFCRECGQFLGLACPSCGNVLLPGSRFCDRCGIRLSNPGSLTGWMGDSLATQAPDTEQRGAMPVAATQPPPLPVARAAGPPGLSEPADLAGATQPTRGEPAIADGHAAEVEGERRVVTMLFCDVYNSTATAEKLDPEEWTEIINGAFEHMIRPIDKFGGTVARLMGDAILAFFGAPLSHEDDPQRAVLAGLEIVAGIAAYRKEVERRWGIDFNVRVGINTGLVVVGNVGSDLRSEYTAMGDAINVAARMEQTAQPGTVRIAEGTYRLVASLFEVEQVGAVVVKGKSEPVVAYRVLKQRSAGRRMRGPGVGLPLIGRAEARRSLSAAIDRVLRGNGQIVTIIGEVGMGKSRLIAEMHAEWDQKSAGVRRAASAIPWDTWYETFSLSYETARPYGLFQNFLRQVLGVAQGEPPAVLQKAIDDFAAAALPGDRAEPVKHALAALFGLSQGDGIAMEGEAFRKQFFQIIASLLEVWAKDSPGVVVCDDLHWSDQASVDLLVHLFQSTERLPILFVCAMRPDRDAPGWQVKVRADADFPHRYSEIQLTPLTQPDSVALVSQLLPGADLPQPLWDTILARASGNPFFLEEVVRALIDDGTLTPGVDGAGWQVDRDHNRPVNVPDSLQSLLMARIDRLDEPHRHTLQLAALIGRSFYYRVLEAIAGDAETSVAMGASLEQHLSDLQRTNLIALAARMPEIEYIFRQALVQELAYSSILRKNRRGYHERVGRAIEALFPNQLEEQAIVLAYHFGAAGDRQRAVKYHTLAGDAAFRLYANREAAQHYADALEAAGEGVSLSTEQCIHLYTRRGRALELSARLEDAVAVYETMRQRAVALGDRAMELAALIPLATLFSTPTSLFDPERGDDLSRQAIGLARTLEDREAEARILWNALNLNRFAGRTEAALEAGEQSLALARELGLREQAAYTANDLSHVYNRIGAYGKTIVMLEEARDIWRELGNMPMLTDNLGTAAYVHAFTGEYDAAAAFSQEAFRISESIQSAWGCSYSQAMVGLAYWQRGNSDLALETMRSSLRYAEKAGFVFPLVYTRADLGVALAELGDFDQGMAAVEEAMRIARDGRPQLLRYALAQLALLHLRAGDLDSAAAAVAEVRALNTPLHMVQPNIVTTAECLLTLRQGDIGEANRLLALRLDDLRRYGMRAYLPEMLFLRAQASRQAGQEDGALASLVEAREVAVALGSQWMEWQILAATADLSPQPEARELRAAARAIIQRIESSISAPALRTSFLNRPDVREGMNAAFMPSR